MTRTGHRSVQGVRTYKRVSDDQKLALSKVLNAATNGEMLDESNPPPEKKPKITALITTESSTISAENACAPAIELDNIPAFHFSGCSSITVNITK